MKPLALLLACVALLVPSAVLATECNSDCKFIRGDVNCDGVVDTDDLYDLYFGSIVNYDAADVNDDGAVTGADLSHLNAWVNSYGTGTAPACPFPTAGLDCSEDYLETCCSPPLGAAAESFMVHTDCLPEVVNNTWDEQSTGTGAGALCHNKFDVWNHTSSCWHDPTTATVAGEYTVQDVVGFTERRLSNGVQKAFLRVEVEVWFDYEGVCVPYECEGTNGLFVDIIPQVFTVYVKARPKVGGGLGSSVVVDSFDKQLKFLYSLTGSIGDCSIEGQGELYQLWQSEPVDISWELGGLPDTACGEWELDDIYIRNMYLNWLGSTVQDVAWYEEISVWVWAWVEYEWCEECQ